MIVLCDAMMKMLLGLKHLGMGQQVFNQRMVFHASSPPPSILAHGVPGAR
jgi:hypothetical protein